MKMKSTLRNSLTPAILIASISALSSCAIIKEYRGAPETWKKNQKLKAESANKSKNKETKAKATKKKNTPTTRRHHTTPAPVVTDIPQPKVNNKKTRKGRVVSGMLEPDVSRIPAKKDLQEIDIPTNQSGPSITIPAQQ